MDRNILEKKYIDIVKSYFLNPGEEHLFKASELGRQLVAENYSLEEIGVLHQSALEQLHEEGYVGELKDSVARLTDPLIELLMSYQLAFLQYIEENKEKSRELRIKERALASAKNGIIITDPNQNDNPIVYVNKAFEIITGYPAEEALGRNCRFLQGGDRDQPGLENIRNAIKGQTEVTEVIRNYRKDGTLFWNELRISPVRTRDGTVTHFVGIQNDITSQIEYQDSLEKSSRELRSLAAHLQSVREEERAQIAREIHDEFGQVLVAIKMSISLLEKEVVENNGHLDKSRFHDEMSEIMSLIDRSIKSLRVLITELRPEILDTLGLWEALKWQIGEFEKHSRIACAVTSNVDKIDLDRHRAIAVFRILQEALTNIRRHARATRVECDFSKNHKTLFMRISDNGIGLPEKEKHGGFGILGMKERVHLIGGKIEFQSRPGKGTTVLVTIPL